MVPAWSKRIMPTPPTRSSSLFETYTHPPGAAKHRPPSGAACHWYAVAATTLPDTATTREQNPAGSCKPLPSGGCSGP